MTRMNNENADTALVSRLLELNKKGFTKTDMAKAAGVSKQAVTGWYKRGSVGKDSAIAIAEAAGVSVSWLLGGEVDEQSGLKPQEQKLMELFRQLPSDDERAKIIMMIELRLKELDDFVQKYLLSRLKDSNS